MENSKDIETVLTYLLQSRITFNTSMDVASIVHIIDRITMKPIQINPLIHSKLYSLVNQLLSPQWTSIMREAQTSDGSVVQ